MNNTSARSAYIAGATYGNLTLIELTASDKHGNRYGIFKCICGKEKELPCFQVKRSAIKSCGCLLIESGRKNLKKWATSRVVIPGNTALGHLYNSYRTGAGQRNLDFLITKEELKAITSRKCAYCGKAPSTVQNIKNKDPAQVYIYNGIDRIDNNVGYLLDNCVPCCTACNRMKGTMTYQQFIDHITSIYSHLKETNGNK